MNPCICSSLPQWFEAIVASQQVMLSEGRRSANTSADNFLNLTTPNSITVQQFTEEWRRVLAGQFETQLRYGLTTSEERLQFFRTIALRPQDLQNCQILIAGCGLARLDFSLRDTGAKIVSLDASQIVEDIAKFAGPSIDHVFVRGDVLNLPFKDESFDLVYCEGVLHHTTNPKLGFQELARVCRKGGRIGFYVYPNKRSLYRWIRYFLPGAWRAPRVMLFWTCWFLGIGLWPFSGEPNPRSTAFTLYDTLCCRDLSEHSIEEMRQWISANGLEEIQLEPSLKHSCVRKPTGSL